MWGIWGMFRPELLALRLKQAHRALFAFYSEETFQGPDRKHMVRAARPQLRRVSASEQNPGRHRNPDVA
jgi:hypothetical protein